MSLTRRVCCSICIKRGWIEKIEKKRWSINSAYGHVLRDMMPRRRAQNSKYNTESTSAALSHPNPLLKFCLRDLIETFANQKCTDSMAYREPRTLRKARQVRGTNPSLPSHAYGAIDASDCINVVSGSEQVRGTITKQQPEHPTFCPTKDINGRVVALRRLRDSQSRSTCRFQHGQSRNRWSYRPPRCHDPLCNPRYPQA